MKPDIKDVDCLKAMTQAEDELFCASFNCIATRLDSTDHQMLYTRNFRPLETSNERSHRPVPKYYTYRHRTQRYFLHVGLIKN